MFSYTSNADAYHSRASSWESGGSTDSSVEFRVMNRNAVVTYHGYTQYTTGGTGGTGYSVLNDDRSTNEDETFTGSTGHLFTYEAAAVSTCASDADYTSQVNHGTSIHYPSSTSYTTSWTDVETSNTTETFSTSENVTVIHQTIEDYTHLISRGVDDTRSIDSLQIGSSRINRSSTSWVGPGTASEVSESTNSTSFKTDSTYTINGHSTTVASAASMGLSTKTTSSTVESYRSYPYTTSAETILTSSTGTSTGAYTTSTWVFDVGFCETSSVVGDSTFVHAPGTSDGGDYLTVPGTTTSYQTGTATTTAIGRALATVVHLNAWMYDLPAYQQRERLWKAKMLPLGTGDNDSYQCGPFSEFFESVAGADQLTIQDYASYRVTSTSERQTAALSTSTSSSTYTFTRSTGNSSGTGSMPTTATSTTFYGLSSLDGAAWDSTATSNIGTHEFTLFSQADFGAKTITFNQTTYDSSGGSHAGVGSNVLFTYSTQTTGYATNGQFTTGSVECTYGGVVTSSSTHKTWWATDGVTVLVSSFESSSMGILYTIGETYTVAAGGETHTSTWQFGQQSTTSQITRMREVSTSYSSYHYSKLLPLYRMVSSSTSHYTTGGAGSGIFTNTSWTNSHADGFTENWSTEAYTSRSQSYSITSFTEARLYPFTSLETFHYFGNRIYPRAWAKVLPRGYAGFGGPFTGDSPVIYSRLNSELISGTVFETTGNELDIWPEDFSLLERLGEYASIIPNHTCPGDLFKAGATASFVGTLTGSAAETTLAVTWSSTTTTTATGTAGSTTRETRAMATYRLQFAGPITGDYFVEETISMASSADYFRPNGARLVGGFALGEQRAESVPYSVTLTGAAATYATVSSGTYGAGNQTSRTDGPMTFEVPGDRAIVCTIDPLLRYAFQEGANPLVVAPKYYEV